MSKWYKNYEAIYITMAKGMLIFNTVYFLEQL